MLENLRTRLQGIVATFIIGFLVLTFAVWGIGEYVRESSKVIVAEVNGIEIDTDEYRNALDRYRGQVDPKLFENPFFKRQVVDGMIRQQLVARALDEGGYAASKQQLSALIRAMPEFQRDGQFDADQYAAVLQRAGQNVIQFESTVRQEKLLDQIVTAFKDSAILPKGSADVLLALAAQQRRVAVAVLDPKDLAPKLLVSEAEVGDYYKQHTDMFREPERVRISYLRLDAKSLSQAYTPTEDELRAAYEEEKGRYTTPATRRVSHILLELPAGAPAGEEETIRKQAESLAKQARTGGDFAALAKKHSQDPESAARGGDLGLLAPGVLPSALERAVLALEQGGITDPVRTEFGYHIAKVTEYTAPKVRGYAAVRTELISLMRQRKSEQRFFELAERLQNLVYEQPDTLEPAAAALGLRIQTSAWFSRDTGPAGLTANPKVVAAAFSPEVLEERRNSETVEIGRDDLIVLRIAEHREARQLPLADVQARVKQLALADKARREARERGEKLLAAVRDGKSLDAAARLHGARYRAPTLLGRKGAAGYPALLVEAVFDQGRPGQTPLVDSVDLGADGYAVYALYGVVEGKAATLAKSDAERLRKQVEDRAGRADFFSYMAGLRQRAEVKIYDKAL
jgi:peptidyl-prolyl cis-trans isomerase D